MAKGKSFLGRIIFREEKQSINIDKDNVLVNIASQGR